MESLGARLLIGIATVGIAGAVLSGCSMHPDPNRKAPEDPIAAARELSDAPPWVAEPAGEDCGTTSVDRGGVVSAEGLECLVAVAGKGREGTLAWVLLTAEGDPIPYFAHAHDTGVDVVSTSEFDAFGAAGWYGYSCSLVTDVPYGESCNGGAPL